MMLGSIWQYLYTSFLRFWFKWFLRQITGKCELQRICHGYEPGAPRTTRIENSLKSSKNKVLQDAVDVKEDAVEGCVTQIVKEKNIKEQKDPKFKVNLHQCLIQISGYNTLFTTVEELRKVTFDSENEEHEKMLLKLWDLLMPSVKLESRVTKQWGDIGFQGDDPKTDFRGMGMLGLVNLVFFSENYNKAAWHVLSHANHPSLGYSYAIVGINLTEMAYSLLRSGALKPHFYNTVAGKPHMHHFHQLYCYLAYEFDKFWVEEKPASIMEFNIYREKFHDKVKGFLLEPEVSLILKLESKKCPDD
ncbi:ELMO domain-containing protein 2 isoform X1 [Ictalurus furcatus]|uniref:ELMO domain-containing protein 2 isoform X1 n=1 Tax=Ictalurus furcatus TaxID=66913 RepID=UPI00234FE3CB|nr:ELMO domain-containing protein 2 isoform X1 [Ictalurus furcatus]XP_053477998.1 ELMO domain-containing protein 2 isoform X1 [Ictalurus furcatus]XP_053477999.1 ELMO domain-containing protein 2 isoform X1 [Ictalurus furcatus]XP_053478000.1 ELMO domain-containing protein 2 isoform X1 [Ictalurus furcatus]XP_053478001.1 ELMO domain-containing protein 2 isoform X1 [Ictalurus furcatus]